MHVARRSSRAIQTIEQKTEEGLELKCLDRTRLILWLIGRIVAVVHR